MAVISTFYAGSVDAAAFSAGIARVGNSEYGVVGTNDLKVTAVSGQDRTVSVTAGQCWGKGVHDVLSPAQTIALPSVASGNRWDLITMRRTWSSKLSVITRVAGGSARTIPTGRLNAYGTVDDQPLALVRVKAGSTAIQEIVDLRVWSANGGMQAADQLALSYLGKPGAAVVVGNTVWRYIVNAGGNGAWSSDFTSSVSPLSILPYWSSEGDITIDSSSGRKRVSGQLELTRQTLPGWESDPGDSFKVLGVVLPSSCRGSARLLYLSGTVSGGRSWGTPTVALNPVNGILSARASTSRIKISPKSTLFVNFDYYL